MEEALCQTDQTGTFVYAKIRAVENHQSDSENLDNCGLIPFGDIAQGFNPGKIMDGHLAESANVRVFQMKNVSK